MSVDGRPIVLQKLEFRLLRYLVNRRNELVTRAELLEVVWGGRARLEGRTVDVHICRLRRKLGRVGKQIQTLISFGYRFVEVPDR